MSALDDFLSNLRLSLSQVERSWVDLVEQGGLFSASDFFSPSAADGELPPWVKNQEPPTAPPVSGIPKVAIPPAPIFTPPSIFVTPPPRKIPSPPARRLAADRKPTPNKQEPAIFVREALTSRKYGALLHEPVSDEELDLSIFAGSSRLDNYLDGQEAAATKFYQSLTGNTGDIRDSAFLLLDLPTTKS